MLRLSPLLALAALAALLLPGCGGGGGGGSSVPRGSLLYQTDWSGTEGGPQGVSQRVAVYTTGGVLVSSVILNKGTTQGSQAAFPNLEQGLYRVVADLFSAADAGGSLTGRVEAIVRIASSTTFKSQVGERPDAIQVTPETLTLTQQQTFDFAALALNTQGEALFTQPGEFTWKVNGGVGTVTALGVVTAQTVGTGSVQANHTPTGLTDSAVLTVSAFNATRSKWTVLVFLNAANDLNRFGDLNFNQMERIAGGSDVRFVVQWKQAIIPGIVESPSFIGTRRYLVKRDASSEIRSELVQNMGEDVDMGQGQTLREFIQWGKTNYPADRYVLVIWNHGNGWRRGARLPEPTRAVSYDDDTGNAIDTWELPEALGTGVVDILAWDASLMQMLEVNYEIRDKALYIAGSEESPPGAGYPYDTVFDDFFETPDAPTATLAKSFVDATLAVSEYEEQKITQSVLEAARLPALAQAVDALAAALIAEKAKNPSGFASYIQAARMNAQAYSPESGNRVYRDLIDLTLELDKAVSGYVPPTSIRNANLAVRAAAHAALVHEGHNAMSPESHGISIDFSSGTRFAGVVEDYRLLDFAEETRWDEWLHQAP